MHKLDKYISSLVVDKERDIIRSTRSNYYHFNGNILRISDHIGINSSGDISIIKTKDDNQYVVHNHKTGDITVISYNDAKKLVKSFGMLSNLYKGANTPNFTIEKETFVNMENKINILKKRMKGEVTSGVTIMGIPEERFSKGQISTIKTFIAQMGYNVKKK